MLLMRETGERAPEGFSLERKMSDEWSKYSVWRASLISEFNWFYYCVLSHPILQR